MEILLLLGLAVAIGVLVAHFSRYVDVAEAPRLSNEYDQPILSAGSLALPEPTVFVQPGIDCGHGSHGGGDGSGGHAGHC